MVYSTVQTGYSDFGSFTSGNIVILRDLELKWQSNPDLFSKTLSTIALVVCADLSKRGWSICLFTLGNVRTLSEHHAVLILLHRSDFRRRWPQKLHELMPPCPRDWRGMGLRKKEGEKVEKSFEL